MKTLLGLLIGIYIGYGYAHHYVAAECDRLGAFFVEKVVYECAVRR